MRRVLLVVGFILLVLVLISFFYNPKHQVRFNFSEPTTLRISSQEETIFEELAISTTFLVQLKTGTYSVFAQHESGAATRWKVDVNSDFDYGVVSTALSGFSKLVVGVDDYLAISGSGLYGLDASLGEILALHGYTPLLFEDPVKYYVVHTLEKGFLTASDATHPLMYHEGKAQSVVALPDLNGVFGQVDPGGTTTFYQLLADNNPGNSFALFDGSSIHIYSQPSSRPVSYEVEADFISSNKSIYGEMAFIYPPLDGDSHSALDSNILSDSFIYDFSSRQRITVDLESVASVVWSVSGNSVFISSATGFYEVDAGTGLATQLLAEEFREPIWYDDDNLLGIIDNKLYLLSLKDKRASLFLPSSTNVGQIIAANGRYFGSAYDETAQSFFLFEIVDTVSPLTKQLPHKTDRFLVDYLDSPKTILIKTLAPPVFETVFGSSGVNRYTHSQYREEALDFINALGVDISSYQIKYSPDF